MHSAYWGYRTRGPPALAPHEESRQQSDKTRAQDDGAGAQACLSDLPPLGKGKPVARGRSKPTSALGKDRRVTYTDWQEPARHLRSATGPATEELLHLAETLGCTHANEPRGVLVAIVEDHLAPVLHGAAPQPATEKQLAYLDGLGHDRMSSGTSRSVASAWIDHYLSIRTVQALEQLELMSGDEVQVVHEFVDAETGEVTRSDWTATVSSIGGNGLVYFRGGNGRCAWPSKLRRPNMPRPANTGGA